MRVEIYYRKEKEKHKKHRNMNLIKRTLTYTILEYLYKSIEK